MEHFKTCPKCLKSWSDRDDFLADPDLALNGYQVDFRKLEYGLFLFTHTVKECNSTFAIRVVEFSDMYTGVVYKERQTGKEGCLGYCKDDQQLDRCNAMCECAYVREIIQMIRSV